jgi:hypothetical protein
MVQKQGGIGMGIRVDFDTLSDEIRDGADFELNGETYTHVDELPENMDDNGRYVTHIYQRSSDGRYFSIDLFWVRYGYEDYSFEKSFNDGDLDEVEKKEVVVVKWVAK